MMILLLMIATYAITFFVPAGSYERVIVDGTQTVVSNSYASTTGSMPFLKWFFAPILLLGADGGGAVIAILIFLVVVGGIFQCLDQSGLMQYALSTLSSRYAAKKYTLLCTVTLFFMGLGSLIGSFEECVPLVPIVVALAVSLGWDAMVGLGMSLLAIGCGFATGICNPFTVGVAQQLAGLAMFSGIAYRLIAFALIYLCLVLFLLHYAKRVEKNPAIGIMPTQGSIVHYDPSVTFSKDKRMQKGLGWFAGILLCGIVLILLSSLVPFLQSIVLPLVAVIFLVAGLTSLRTIGKDFKWILSGMKKGAVSMLPAMMLILFASSIRYTLVESQTMDTLLHMATSFLGDMPTAATILIIYLVTLVAEFFISSGSAKAFLLIPLIMPLLDIASIDRQVGILAFAFGDGFSNVFYFTNPVLLISLGLLGIGYGSWVKFTWKIQLVILAITGAMLVICA